MVLTCVHLLGPFMEHEQGLKMNTGPRQKARNAPKQATRYLPQGYPLPRL